MQLLGQLAVVTGASSGVGKGIVEKCTTLGCNVAMIDIDEESLKQFEYEMTTKYPSLKIIAFSGDVSDYTTLKHIVNDIKTQFNTNSIQLLFNNVGISCMGDILYSKYGNSNDIDLKRLKKTMDCNIWAMIYLTRLCLPLLLNNNSNQ
eukprot:309457_1